VATVVTVATVGTLGRWRQKVFECAEGGILLGWKYSLLIDVFYQVMLPFEGTWNKTTAFRNSAVFLRMFLVALGSSTNVRFENLCRAEGLNLVTPYISRVTALFWYLSSRVSARNSTSTAQTKTAQAYLETIVNTS
jgi:hypothetical protein